MPVEQMVRVRAATPIITTTTDALGSKWVSMRSDTEGASVVCTVSGKSFPYSGEFNVTEDSYIEAYAQKEGWEHSQKASLWVTVDKAHNPLSTLTAGEVQEIVLSCPDQDATIWYRAAKDEPFVSGNRIPVVEGHPMAVEAYATLEGRQPSAVVSSFFFVASAPEISIASGFYNQPISLEFSGNGIQYRINDGPFQEYDGSPLILSRFTRLDVLRRQEGLINSSLVSRSYSILKPIAFPVLSVETEHIDNKDEEAEAMSEIQIWNVGDTGPAGGFIFYDKGNYFDGWRFLEAAPSDEESGYRWGQYGAYCNAKRLSVGSGKYNTEVITGIEKNKNNATRICCEKILVVEGKMFDDWYLPSRDELVLLGTSNVDAGLASTHYWSSSEESPTLAWEYNMITKTATPHYKSGEHAVRAIRAF